MKVNQIRKQIADAVAVEKETGNLAELIRKSAKAQNIELTNENLNNLFGFLQNYIEHVPALLEKLADQAQERNMYEDIAPVLQTVQQYFLSSNDVIPDRLGLLGLLDDAYLAHRVMQEIAEMYSREKGIALLPVDTTPANELVRELIGEPHVSMLEAGIQDELTREDLQQSLITLLQSENDFRLAGPDPVWGTHDLKNVLSEEAGGWGIS